jgi:hypothetical protein
MATPARSSKKPRSKAEIEKQKQLITKHYAELVADLESVKRKVAEFHKKVLRAVDDQKMEKVRGMISKF